MALTSIEESEMRPNEFFSCMLALATTLTCNSARGIDLPDAGAGDVDVASADAGSPTTWLDHLTELGSDSAHSLYAYHLVAAPPDGAHYYLAIHHQAASDACAHYSGGGMTTGTGGDFWLLEVELGGGVSGRYGVVFPNYTDHGPSSATIRLSHRANGGWLESYNAVGGQITVVTAPSIADTQVGGRLTGVIEADFESEPMQLVSCQGGASVSTGRMESMCNCTRIDGTTFSCLVALDELQTSCCHTPGAPTIHVMIALNAEYCSGMCAVLTGLPPYCASVI
jgi:hypothetical protein